MMKKLLVLLCMIPLVAIAQKQPRGVVYDTVITRIVDGDTIGIEAKFLPPPLKSELSVRVYGVDTPEKGHRAKCPSEAARGAQATEFTNRVIANSKKRQIFLIR